jgi:competence protein ComEA
MVFINNYFGFNRQQRNGLLVLLVISLLLLAARITLPYFIQPEEITVLNLPLVSREYSSGNIKPRTTNAQRFVFDPNSVTHEQLLKLGFSEKTAKTFVRYRSKGFVFREKRDVQKIYGITPELFRAIEPYILIGNGNKRSFRATEEKKEHLNVQQAAKVELNAADSASLVSLNGIGAGYARRILKYRSILGGFVSIDQLHEVYGFTDELFEKIKNSVTVDPSRIKKIDLNRDDFKTVNRHPYLSYELTKSIFDWRRKTTINATNLKEILNDPALYERLKPYLSFE